MAGQDADTVILCSKCRKRLARPGKKTCEACAARMRARSRARYHRSKENGLCLRCCQDPALPGQNYCARCAGKVQQSWAEADRRKYQQRKTAGLCTKCGTAPAAPGRTQCPVCLAAAREAREENYRFYKEHGICTVCHSRDSIPGLTRCVDCTLRDIDARAMRAPTAERKERQAATSRARRQALKDAGLCVTCGQRPAADGHVQCMECRARRRRKCNERRPPKEIKAPELCTWCDNPHLPGKKLCQACYDARFGWMKEPPRAGLKYMAGKGGAAPPKGNMP